MLKILQMKNRGLEKLKNIPNNQSHMMTKW